MSYHSSVDEPQQKVRDFGIPQMVTVHQFHLITKLDLNSQVSQTHKFLGDSREDQKKIGVEVPFSSTQDPPILYPKTNSELHRSIEVILCPLQIFGPSIT